VNSVVSYCNECEVTATLVSKANAQGNQEELQNAVSQALVLGFYVSLIGTFLMLKFPDKVLASVLKGEYLVPAWYCYNIVKDQQYGDLTTIFMTDINYYRGSTCTSICKAVSLHQIVCISSFIDFINWFLGFSR
jgi:hypothetical protein